MILLINILGNLSTSSFKVASLNWSYAIGTGIELGLFLRVICLASNEIESTAEEARSSPELGPT